MRQKQRGLPTFPNCTDRDRLSNHHQPPPSQHLHSDYSRVMTLHYASNAKKQTRLLNLPSLPNQQPHPPLFGSPSPRQADKLATPLPLTSPTQHKSAHANQITEIARSLSRHQGVWTVKEASTPPRPSFPPPLRLAAGNRIYPTMVP